MRSPYEDPLGMGKEVGSQESLRRSWRQQLKVNDQPGALPTWTTSVHPAAPQLLDHAQP